MIYETSVLAAQLPLPLLAIVDAQVSCFQSSLNAKILRKTAILIIAPGLTLRLSSVSTLKHIEEEKLKGRELAVTDLYCMPCFVLNANLSTYLSTYVSSLSTGLLH